MNSLARLSSPETPPEVALVTRPLKGPKERQRHIGRHVAELLCLLIFIATVLTGGMLQGDERSLVTPTGLESALTGSNSALRIAHLVLAAVLSISILWHVFVLRRRVTRLVRRRRPGNRVALAKWVGFLLLYCASFATGVFVTQPSRAQGHIAISLIVLVCLAIHLFKRAAGHFRRQRHMLRAQRRAANGVSRSHDSPSWPGGE
jgi:heme A synthase